jgi:hypothetical protein
MLKTFFYFILQYFYSGFLNIKCLQYCTHIYRQVPVHTGTGSQQKYRHYGHTPLCVRNTGTGIQARDRIVGS